MKRELLLMTAIAFSCPANGQELKIPPDKKEAAGRAMMRLAFADGCNKRLDNPSIFIDAKAAFLKFAESIDMPNASTETDRVAQLVVDRPSEKQDGPITLFNPTICGQLADSLKKELAE